MPAEWQSRYFIPSFHSSSREEIGGRSRGGTIVNTRLAGQDFVAQGGHLSSNDSDRSGVSVGDESSLVIAEDEFPNKREGLHQEYQTVQDNRNDDHRQRWDCHNREGARRVQ